MLCRGQHTATVGNLKIALSQKFALLLHPHVDVPFRTVWLLHNLTLDGKLCLRDDKNAASVMTKLLPLYNFTIPCRGRRAWKMPHYTRAYLSEAVSDWLNPLSLGVMSASGYIEDLA